jgi:hypothetical protein
MTMGKKDQGAPGPLVVSRSNPRYFIIGSGDDGQPTVLILRRA